MRRTAPVLLRSTTDDAAKWWEVEAAGRGIDGLGGWRWRSRISTFHPRKGTRVTVGPWIDLPSEPDDEKLRELRDESVASFLSDPLAPWERA